MKQYLRLYPEVHYALENGQPIVALESAVITHGLPYPENVQLAEELEQTVRNEGAIPATIAFLDGYIHIGLSPEDRQRLATATPKRKVSLRDMGIVLSRKEAGGTTVAATLQIAHQVGIKVFATGGIGGVHRESPFDISTDLPTLSRTPLVVVSAGAKAILDLPATLEVLETMGVPVIGYRTDEFPAFYSRESGLPVNVRVESPQEVAEIARTQWDCQLHSAVLVVNPPPAETALPREAIEALIQKAVREAFEEGIRGAEVTPFLLARVSALSGGESLKANLALLRSNARLAAQIAHHLYTPRHLFRV
ncbi:pseudouridine-5'-phosphate glycosidase [Thermanaerothrix daxensis]|uniref:Pseudouridine-5'-phosphate glycosidase n=1 Tax=Thermanaerothrix daxensis TaxID=869279 RepID=A0A0N8GQR5_9CHLR|nr:pseudouridine-5'-phosphate glycosidase [Thermanaerothrix daxensis]KPL84434.1 pseudouridine-5'-phosphate glycosidase [Thermanaerothrix daxensis]